MKKQPPSAMSRAALACAALLACTCAAAQPRTSLQVMPAASPAAPAQAYGLSDGGVVVGSQTVPGAAGQSFVWNTTVGSVQLLGQPGGALGVGASGTVVGSAVFDGVGLRGYAWTPPTGGQQNLGVLPGGSLSFATGVDDAGRIVGVSQVGGSQSHAFLLEPGLAMRDLGTLGGRTSSAHGVAAGIVVGSSTDATGALQAFAWTAAGGMQGVGPIGEASEARAVNRNGLVVGRVVVGGNDMAFLWTPGGRAQVLGGSETFHGAAVNDAGQVVLRHGAGGNSMLWVQGGTPAKLHTLAGSGVALFDATAINRYAQVAGTATGTATAGVARPVLLTLHPDWQGGSGHWDNTGGAHWNWAGTGVAAATVGAMHQVVIDPEVDATVTVVGAVARSLRVGGRGTNAVVLQMGGGTVTLGSSATVAAGGTLTGNGTLRAETILIAQGAHVEGGSNLTLDGGYFGVTNAGTVKAGLAQPGTVSRFDLPSGLHNMAGGSVEVVNAQVRYGESVVNGGLWKWSGNTRIVAEAGSQGLFNNSGRLVYGAGWHASVSFSHRVLNHGHIELSSGATWDLDMDLVSGGTIDIAAGALLELRGSEAQVAGATGHGRIRAQGELTPYGAGRAVRIEPALALLHGGHITMELDSWTPGAGPEKFIFDGATDLAGGWLLVMAGNGQTFQAGQVYDLFDWNGGVSGTFSSLRLPTLSDGLAWDASDLYLGGTLSVSVSAVPEARSLALMLAGLAGLLPAVRRRQRQPRCLAVGAGALGR